MSKTKELRELIDKVKGDISVQIDTIVEWNLDNSDHVQELYRLSKDKIGKNYVNEFNELLYPYLESKYKWFKLITLPNQLFAFFPLLLIIGFTV